MGDFAIKAINYITKRRLHVSVIPAGSTYKIQGRSSFDIEKSKRAMIAEDIARAMALL